jgi:hypothetical protein
VIPCVAPSKGSTPQWPVELVEELTTHTPKLFRVCATVLSPVPGLSWSRARMCPLRYGKICLSLRYHGFRQISLFVVLALSRFLPFQEFYDRGEFTQLDPDNGDHLLVCLGGDWTASGQQNLPYRGVDSTYTNRFCSSGEELMDIDENPIGAQSTTSDELCNHYSPEEVKQIPHISDNVKAALDFLGKDKDGFFLMYEQGDVSPNLFVTCSTYTFATKHLAHLLTSLLFIFSD